MMIKLAPAQFEQIKPWFLDFQKKSKNYEIPPNNAEIIGIWKDEELVGYFITVCYDGIEVEINQGYLKREVRHKNLSRIAMSLLEDLAKRNGFKRIILGTNRAVNSYIKFMASMGYGLTRAIFAKEVK